MKLPSRTSIYGNVTRPILRYYGGKWLTAPWIISHFPSHRTYVEPFGGAASVLLQKPRSYAEVYNDIDGEVVNVFRVLREHGEELMESLRLTPFAREEHALAYKPTKNPIEAARRTVLKAFLGYGSDSIWRKSGFRANTSRSGTTPAKDWAHFPAALPSLIERIRGVVLEHKDAFEIIEQYKDKEDALIYCDPPYLHFSRAGGERYLHELSEKDHVRLAKLLKHAKAKVCVSGYRSELYDQLYKAWHRDERSVLAQYTHHSANAKRVEVLWSNFEIHRLL